jgi:heparan-alpha-glucosaminide N-acetyltransferase
MNLPTALHPNRLASMDAYRGAVMLLMASEEFGIPQVARHFPKSETWQRLAYQFSHVEWRGWSLWDMIQPSFMFLVGVSMMFSYAARKARGDSPATLLRHAIVRAIILTFLGVFLRSNGRDLTYFTFEDVLSQIGLGYVFLYLLWDKGWRVQLAAAVAILIAYWALFAFYPTRPPDFDYSTVRAEADWKQLQGFEAHWDKNTNPASDFDVWFLNKFPRQEPFKFNGGGYQTLSFIPSLATMVFGLLAGGMLQSGRGAGAKVAWLVLGGVALVALGLGLDAAGVCPLVKRIWTPSWAVFSGGVGCAVLGLCYMAVDVSGWQAAFWPLRVVGMNSIAMYLMAQLTHGWISGTWRTHFGPGVFQIAGEAYEPMVEHLLVLAVMWLVCVWMYRNKIFVRI